MLAKHLTRTVLLKCRNETISKLNSQDKNHSGSNLTHLGYKKILKTQVTIYFLQVKLCLHRVLAITQIVIERIKRDLKRHPNRYFQYYLSPLHSTMADHKISYHHINFHKVHVIFGACLSLLGKQLVTSFKSPKLQRNTAVCEFHPFPLPPSTSEYLTGVEDHQK